MHGNETKEKKFIRHELLIRMVTDARRAGYNSEALLYVMAYAFLLRVPSEALPMMWVSRGQFDEAPNGQSECTIKDGKLFLRLKMRKNRRGGSIMSRGCWCEHCQITCPVHVAERLAGHKRAGEQWFAGVSADQARTALRDRLRGLGVKEAFSYGTHDFRRGHCMDMVLQGKELHEVLQAGQWKSSAFMHYIERHELECGAVMEAHMAESEDE